MQSSQTTAEKAIRLHLAARKKNQAWLAARLGESAFWVGRRMSGVVLFDVGDLDRIAAVFGVDLDDLLAAADAIKVPEAVA
jgi:hypothetical protein